MKKVNESEFIKNCAYGSNEKKSVDNNKLEKIAEKNLKKYKYAFEVLGNGEI